MVISKLSLSFYCFKKAIVCYWPVDEPLDFEDDCNLRTYWFNLSFSCLSKAIVFSFPLDNEALLLKVETYLVNLSFYCLKRVTVLSEMDVLLKVLIYLFNLSFYCLKRAIVCYDPDPDDVFLSEAFSISTILSLKT